MRLAIDTSIGTSVALVDGDAVLLRHVGTDTRGHAEALGQLLHEAAVHRAAITDVVVGMGPGPFTGLRVGIAAGQAFARGLRVPCLGICSHDAAGLAAGEDAVVTSDVRRGERAWSRYLAGARVEGPLLAPADAVPVPAGVRRIDLDAVDSVALAAVADRAPLVREALYLRPADAVVPGAPKRVSP